MKAKDKKTSKPVGEQTSTHTHKNSSTSNTNTTGKGGDDIIPTKDISPDDLEIMD